MARDSVAEVRERTDVVELVGQYVSLQRQGRSYKGSCPFHQEKTPSFVVFPDSQNFHSFGCGKGGDVFSFYMGIEHVDFREALQELARRAGVELESVPTVAPEVDAHRQRLIELNELAATFYANVLTNSQAGGPGREVVERRGLSPEMIARFGLGYALDQWDALHRYLAGRGVDPELAAEAGLLQRRDGGGYYDRFRHRFMFPIRTREGRVVGFGARALGDAQPKYLNSAQSSIFDKSTLVYGLDLAQEEIRKRDQVVIVEGYMDAIAAHQFGHGNVVAAMGTAVTEAQIGLVKRLSKRIVLALDADTAGQMATLRGLETLGDALDADAVPVPGPDRLIRFERKLNAQIAIVRLPEGKDPDELIRKSPERWPEVVAAAQPFLDFYVEAITAGIAPEDAAAKSEAVKRAAPILQQVGDRVVQAHYVGLLARRLQLQESVVLGEVRRSGLRSAPVLPARLLPTARSALGVGRASHEDHLLALLLKHRAICAGVLTDVAAEDVMDSRNRELLRVLRDPAIPLDLPPEQLVHHAQTMGLDEAVAEHADRLLASMEGKPAQYPGQIERDARQALERLGKERFDYLMRQLQAGIQAAQQAADQEALLSLSGQLALLYERHRRFYPPPSPYFRDSRDNLAPRR
jgi:DNA primase